MEAGEITMTGVIPVPTITVKHAWAAGLGPVQVKGLKVARAIHHTAHT